MSSENALDGETGEGTDTANATGNGEEGGPAAGDVTAIADAVGSDGDTVTAAADESELAVQVELLAEENRRLRREYARIRTSRYRRTAIGLLVLGALGIAAGVVFEASRTVLFALGATGVFASLLTYYLTPEQFVAATVGERVYAALASNQAAVAADLGLADTRLYVPTGDTQVRLFVPQHEPFEVPETEALASAFVVTDDSRSRGVAFEPTGQALFAEFERALAGDLREETGPLAEQLVDALVEQFELVDSTRVDVDAPEGRVTVGVSGSKYGAVDRFDHPVASFLAVGIARGRDEPVTLDVDDGDDRSEYLVTVRPHEADE